MSIALAPVRAMNRRLPNLAPVRSAAPVRVVASSRRDALLAGLLILVIAVAVASLMWPEPRLSLAGCSGTWKVDAAALPLDRRGLGAADAEMLAAWKDAVLVIGDGRITLRAGGAERSFALSEGRASSDMLGVTAEDGMAWTLLRQGGRLTVFTGTRAGSIQFIRADD